MAGHDKQDISKVRTDNVQPIEKRGGWMKPVQQQVVQMQPTNQQPQQSGQQQSNQASNGK